MKPVAGQDNCLDKALAMIADSWHRADIGTDFSRIVLLVLLALGLGLIYNVAFIWPNRPPAAPGQVSEDVSEIAMEQAYQLAQDQQAVIVDTREPADYAYEHIAGALTLPSIEFDSYYPDFARQVAQDQTVILYCARGCDSKRTVAEQLRKRGYRHVNVMAAEPEDWAAMGYPIATAEDTSGAEGESQ